MNSPNYENPGQIYNTADLNERSFDSWKLFLVAKKWAWAIALFMLLVASLTLVAVLRMQPIYSASTTIEIKQAERNIIGFSDVDSIVADTEFLTTQVELLRSTSLAQDVVKELNLLSDPYFGDFSDEQAVEISQAGRLKIATDILKGNLVVAPVGRTRLIRVSFEHSSPEGAAKIANGVVKKFISNSADRKVNTTSYAEEFLQEQLVTVRAALEESEREWVQYASDNSIIELRSDESLGADPSLDASALIVLDAELIVARTERDLAESSYNQALQSSFSSDLTQNEALNSMNEKKLELEAEYIEKSALFKPGFPEMIEIKDRIDFINQEIESQTKSVVSGKVEEARIAFILAKEKEEGLQRRVSLLKVKVVDKRAVEIDYNILKRQVETNRNQYDAILQRLKEVGFSENLEPNLLAVVDVAQPSSYPVRPNKLFALLGALVTSGSLGFFLAFFVETINDKIKSPRDIKDKLKQATFAVIPVAKTKGAIVDLLEDPQSEISEAYSTLRTNLTFSGGNDRPRVIQFTSSQSGEGKSVSSLALSIRISAGDKKVLLIDCDMRRPTFLTDIGESMGLSGVLTAQTSISSAILESRYPNLDLIPSGVLVPNPADLLASDEFDSLLEYAKNNYDYVIVDSPPILGLADALILASKVDATLFVVQSNYLKTSTINSSLERVVNGESNLLGVVMTKYKPEIRNSDNNYSYSYKAQGQEKKKPKKSKDKLSIT